MIRTSIFFAAATLVTFTSAIDLADDLFRDANGVLINEGRGTVKQQKEAFS